MTDELIINGIIDDSLARGLRKRLWREEYEQMLRAKENLRDRKFRGSLQNQLNYFSNQAKRVFKAFYIYEVRKKRSITVYTLVPEVTDDLRITTHSLRLNQSKLYVTELVPYVLVPFPVVISAHYVERYYKRINKLSSLSDFTSICIALINFINSPSFISAEIGDEFEGCIEGGVLIVRVVTGPCFEKEAVVVSFLGKKQLNNDRFAWYEETQELRETGELQPNDMPMRKI